MYVLFVMFAALTFAEDKPAPLIPVTLSRDAENRILKAEHAHDQAVKLQTDTSMQTQQLQMQANQIKERLDAQAKDADAKEKAASKDVDAAIEQAWKDAGLDKAKYDFDAADFTFKPKPPPAPPAQAKK